MLVNHLRETDSWPTASTSLYLREVEKKVWLYVKLLDMPGTVVSFTYITNFEPNGNITDKETEAFTLYLRLIAELRFEPKSVLPQGHGISTCLWNVVLAALASLLKYLELRHSARIYCSLYDVDT